MCWTSKLSLLIFLLDEDSSCLCTKQSLPFSVLWTWTNFSSQLCVKEQTNADYQMNIGCNNFKEMCCCYNSRLSLRYMQLLDKSILCFCFTYRSISREGHINNKCFCAVSRICVLFLECESYYPNVENGKIRSQEAIGSISATLAKLRHLRLWTCSLNQLSRGCEKWGKTCSLSLKCGLAGSAL